eukprot:16076-Heterococcus_DN1.PRE.1
MQLQCGHSPASHSAVTGVHAVAAVCCQYTDFHVATMLTAMVAAATLTAQMLTIAIDLSTQMLQLYYSTNASSNKRAFYADAQQQRLFCDCSCIHSDEGPRLTVATAAVVAAVVEVVLSTLGTTTTAYNTIV